METLRFWVTESRSYLGKPGASLLNPLELDGKGEYTGALPAYSYWRLNLDI